MRHRIVLVALGCVIGGMALAAKDKPDEAWSVASLKAAMEKAKPLNQKMGPPKPGEWLDRFKEKGQTFDEYLKCRPNVPPTSAARFTCSRWGRSVRNSARLSLPSRSTWDSISTCP